MLDDEFSVYFDEQKRYILSDIPNKGTKLFSLTGDGSYHGFEAINSLISALNNPKIDDTYTKLSFLIEPPMIHFNPIIDKKRGEKLVITAITNLRVDDEIFINVFASDDIPKKAHIAKPFSIIKGTIKVLKGEGGLNKISFEIDTTTFSPGNYIIKTSAMDIDISSSTSFKID